MPNNDQGKFLVYLNCLLYMFVAIMLIYGAREIINSEHWENVNANTGAIYAALLSGAALFMVVIAFGLLGFKNWARVMAIPWNLAVAFLLVGLKLVPYLLLDESPDLSGYFDLYTIFQTFIGVALIFLSMSYSKESMKRRFL